RVVPAPRTAPSLSHRVAPLDERLARGAATRPVRRGRSPSPSARPRVARPAGPLARAPFMKIGADMRVLVLGGDGYCGWPTALHLSARGHVVGTLARFVLARWGTRL